MASQDAFDFPSVKVFEILAWKFGHLEFPQEVHAVLGLFK